MHTLFLSFYSAPVPAFVVSIHHLHPEMPDNALWLHQFLYFLLTLHLFHPYGEECEFWNL